MTDKPDTSQEAICKCIEAWRSRPEFAAETAAARARMERMRNALAAEIERQAGIGKEEGK